MKKQKLLLSALLLLFAVSSALGQDLAVKHDTELIRSGFTKFTVGGQRFSFRDAGKYIGDAGTIDRIRKGLIMEKTAIGLGVPAPAVIFVGFSLFFEIRDPAPAHSAKDWLAPTMIGLGGAMGITAIVLGSVGNVMVKKAVRSYNAASGYRSELRFGMAVTSGGLGLQLTF